MRVACGETGASNTCHLQDTTAAQLVQRHALLKAVCGVMCLEKFGLVPGAFD